jgi:hypothetical protein
MCRRVARWILAGLAGLVPAGCAGPMLTPVRDPAQRFDGPGFSVGAPPGDAWYVVPPAPGRIHFAKKVGTGPVPTVYAAAWIARVEARPTRAEDLGPFKMRELERVRRQEPDYVIVLRELRVDRTPGAECVRWEQEEEQRNHPNPALRGYVLVTTTRGFDCLHPLDQRHIVTVGYSERRIKGTPSLLAPGAPVGGEGEAFLRSIRFVPLP